MARDEAAEAARVAALEQTAKKERSEAVFNALLQEDAATATARGGAQLSSSFTAAAASPGAAQGFNMFAEEEQLNSSKTSKFGGRDKGTCNGRGNDAAASAGATFKETLNVNTRPWYTSGQPRTAHALPHPAAQAQAQAQAPPVMQGQERPRAAGADPMAFLLLRRDLVRAQRVAEGRAAEYRLRQQEEKEVQEKEKEEVQQQQQQEEQEEEEGSDSGAEQGEEDVGYFLDRGGGSKKQNKKEKKEKRDKKDKKDKKDKQEKQVSKPRKREKKEKKEKKEKEREKRKRRREELHPADEDTHRATKR